MESIDASPEINQDVVPIGAGAMLRNAREAQGLHIAMLAVALKVPVKKLEALEADRYDLLPDTVFVRALASSVCRALKIEVAPVLSALPRSHVTKIKTDASGLNATFNDSPRGSGQVFLSRIPKPLSVVIGLLVAGIVAIVFLPSRAPKEVAPVAQESEPPPSPANLPVAEVSQPSVASINLSPSVPSLTLSDSVNVTPPVGIIKQDPMAQSGSSSANVLPSSDVLIAANDSSVLTLHAHGSSWVEVTDAKGALQLRKTLTKDEIVPVTGALPLVVVLGRADLVSVAVRGQPFDALAVSKDNVARFEVK